MLVSKLQRQTNKQTNQTKTNQTTNKTGVGHDGDVEDLHGVHRQRRQARTGSFRLLVQMRRRFRLRVARLCFQKSKNDFVCLRCMLKLAVCDSR